MDMAAIAYDGRWQPVARDIVAHFGLKPGMRVLDVGCGKGFLVKDAAGAMPGLEAFGLDISRLRTDALRAGNRGPPASWHRGENAVSRWRIRLRAIAQHHSQFPARAGHDGNARDPTAWATAAPSFKSIPICTPAQKEMFESWVLTAEFHDYPDGWLKVFADAGYTGDYDWTIIE